MDQKLRQRNKLDLLNMTKDYPIEKLSKKTLDFVLDKVK